MTDLLIHSMAEFAPIIRPCLERAKVRDIIEIGAEYGGMSTILADHCAAQNGTFTTIDPAPKPAFRDWVAERDEVRHCEQPSLEALAQLAEEDASADAFFVDGDHNYYTVINELQAIDALAQQSEKPLLIFLHDAGWPCARRDFYYAPDRIPAEHRHLYSFENGIHVDHTQMLEGRGLRGMGEMAIALQYGGPKNGVLTAIEDFLEATNTAERPLAYAHIPAVFGLGIIMDASAEWADDLASIVLPYHNNELLASLEVNRLRNWLAVIDWQDRHREAAG